MAILILGKRARLCFQVNMSYTQKEMTPPLQVGKSKYLKEESVDLQIRRGQRGKYAVQKTWKNRIDGQRGRTGRGMAGAAQL